MLKSRKGETDVQVSAAAMEIAGDAHPYVHSSFRDGWQRAYPKPPRRFVFAAWLSLWLMAALCAAPTAQAQTAAGTNIDNVASADYLSPGGVPVTVPSPLDRITVVIERTPSIIEFLKFGGTLPSGVPTDIGPQQCSASGDGVGPFSPAPGMTDFAGNPIDVTAPVPLVADGAYHAGEPVFIRLIDLDQNLDPLTVETVDITLTSTGGDQETLRLSENGPNTGIFLGYIMSATPPPASGDCRISVDVGESITASYTDPVDGTDASSDVSLVDPFGVVFDSATGQPVDGATVTLWDVLLGTPARVIGDDGLSIFPSTIVSGATATDAGGQFYDFPPGQYRFPFVSPGEYELRITPPSDYAHPSGVSDAMLQSLPGGPFEIVPGSRGETFIVPVGPAVRVDIPLDPLAGDLLVTKQAGKTRVGTGEFVPYRVRITNSSAVTLATASLVDRLPARFRYENGSGQIVGGASIDPEISNDGRELRFDLGNLAPNASVEVQYIARVLEGARPGEKINRAFVEAAGGVISNLAEAVVELEPDLFDERAYLLGRIHIDACDLDVDEPSAGLAGVRVYLEDGSFVVTDDEGRYHFEAISAGLHVVQLDLETIPDEYEPVECAQSQRKAGRAFSEFVEVQPGTLWRSDFNVRRKVPEDGVLSQKLRAQVADDRVDYEIELKAEAVSAAGVMAMVSLPDGLEFLPDSATIDGATFNANADEGMVMMRVGRMPANASRTLRFSARVASAAEGLLETQSILRAKDAKGASVNTPAATLRFPVLMEPVTVAKAAPAPAPEPPIPGPMPAAAPIAPNEDPEPALAPLPPKVLKHRLLHIRRAGLEQYVMQIFVEADLPDLILAEVDLPTHHRFFDWTPRNELGDHVTTVRRGSTIRFVLPKHASEDAVRVFLVGGEPQNVLQVFFSAEEMGAGEAKATSRVLPSPQTRPSGEGFAGRARPTFGGSATAPGPAAPRGGGRAAAARRIAAATATAEKNDANEAARRTGLVGALPSVNPDGSTGSSERSKSASGGSALASATMNDSAGPAGASETLPVQHEATSSAKLAAAEQTEADAELAADELERDRLAALAAAEREKVEKPEARFSADWLARAEPGEAIVYPEEGALPRIPSLKVGIQHSPQVGVELFLNDINVTTRNFDGRTQNQARTVALSRFRGIDLQEGPNRMVAVFRDGDGNELKRQERIVHLSGAPVRATLVPEASSLIADGRTAPVLALRLIDRWGQPVREGSTGAFDLDPPYQTEEQVEAERTAPLAGLGFDRPSFVVDEGGIARIRLYPTSVVGEARLRFQFREDREDEVLAWLEPGDRDWVLVGLATGTVGYNDATSAKDSRRADGVDDGVYTEGRVAFFAKGRIPGNLLLTAAYDSDADRTRLGDRLFQTLEPDEHYTLYGDTTQRDFDAPTSGRLYVKVERKQFYALYGDYQTDLNDTELGRYSRALTGTKMEYRGKRFEAKAFVTDSDQSFVRDEILGDGTSGLYRLSREDIVPGSETVTIETRDRFRPEIVLSSETQGRFGDYDIDYRDGTLFFRRPIAGQDDNFDPIFIVVDYETNEKRDNAVTGGGRVAGRAVDGRIELGFTGIHEDRGDTDAQLFSGDATFKLSPTTEARAEFAHSRANDFAGDVSDEAWLVELDHRGEKLDVRAYAREQGEEFGLGQQRGTQGALRSYGIDTGVDWTNTIRSDSSVFRQENLATGSKRHVAELQSRWQGGRFGLNGGARYSGDEIDGELQHAAQVLAGGNANFFDGRLTFRAEGEAAIEEDRFGDYPYRAILGADVLLHKKLTLFVDQEFTYGDEQRSADTRAGFRGTPWKGASVTTSVSQEQREFGPRTFANLGLQQRWDLANNWGLDISIDRTATIRDPGNSSFNTSGAPAASGSFNNDYTAVSVGTAYREEGWSGTGRLEARFAENEDRWGFIAGLLRDQNRDLSWSAKLDLFYTDSAAGAEELRTDTSLSLAYRPLRSHFIVLERLDFEYRDQTGSDFDFESRKLLNHLKINHLFDRRTQLSWQLSNKLVVDTIQNEQFTTFGTLAGVEMRKDFRPGWDMAMHGRIRHQTSGDEISGSYGMSIGRILVDNVWVSLGYNLTGFYDPEFSASEYTAQGPYFRIRAKFDQLSVQEALKLFR
ncbi:MAG: hypothetical protein AB8G23_18945 [Myxococcota bacterium]